MKLTTIFLLAACLQLSAKGVSQTVSITVKDVPLLTVLKEIKKQTGYFYLADNEWLQKAKTVTITAINWPLSKVLDECFKGQPLTYNISGKVINIIPKEEKVKSVSVVNDVPPIDVRGRVVNENGEPVQASISVKGTTIGTTTNDKGEFHLKNLDDASILIISGVGIETREVKINGQTNLYIKINVAIKPLEETVIKGYYTTTKRLNTGNVATVKANDFDKQPVQNPLLALEGRVPGLFLTQNSGMPGGGVTVRIEGQNSITKGNDPFYVIDGVPYVQQLLATGPFAKVLASSGGTNVNVYGNPLSFISPADIESIEILKDADATAIYGSRAANGAILITTKRGKAGKMKVDINAQTGYGKMNRRVDLLTTDQYLQMRREAKKNDNAAVFSSDYDINGTWDTVRYTDWQKKLLGNTATYTDAQLTVSEGNASTQYLIGMAYHRETTVFPGKFSDQKASAHFNLNSASENQKFKVSLSNNFVFDDNSVPPTDITATAIRLPPNAPELLNSDGTFNWAPDASGNSTWTSGVHPLNYLSQTYSIKAKNFISNLTTSYQVLRHLELKASLGYTNLQDNEMYLSPLSGYAPEQRPFFLRTANYVDNSISTWIIEPQINYNRSIGKGRFDFLVGSTFQQTASNNQVIRGQGFISDELLKDVKAAPTISATINSDALYKYSAAFSRINYNLSDKYVINLTGRRDGSSRFGVANQFHNFGAVGAAWIFSSEKFVNQFLPILSFGKLRGSYGTSGNDQIGDYQFMTLYSSLSPAPAVSYQGVPGLRPTTLTNPYLQWENTKKLQLGVDLGFLNDKILLSTNYFKNRSSNQLLNYALPIMTGFYGVTTNFPAIVENSGWEFALNTNLSKRGFTWKVNLNLTIPRNKLVEFPNLENSTYSGSLVVGQPISIIRAYQFAGIDPTLGNPLFITASGDKSATPVSVRDQTVLINTLPRYYGGFENSFSFKGFQLDFLFQFVKQIASNWHFGSFLPGGLYANQPSSVLNRWQKPGDQTDIQRFNSDFSLAFFHSNIDLIDASYSDASYIRLKNVSFSWIVPSSLQKKLSFSNLILFFRGQNLLTITHYEGLDPETHTNGTATTLPPLTVYTFGIKVGL